MKRASPLVVVIEDEPQMRRFIRSSLTSHDYRLLEADTGKEGVALITSNHPDLVLLDLGLPDGDGIELTRELRQWTKTPVIVLSARGREDDKVTALDAGADDYLTKPFGVKELLARMRVALRHAEAGEPMEAARDFGPLRIDFEKRIVSRCDREVHLTPTEYRLLTLLARNAGKVLTYSHILKEVWGAAYSTQPHYVRVHMAELRKKVEENPARPQLLVTEPGVGYRLRDPS